jgi:hypothetical protein
MSNNMMKKYKLMLLDIVFFVLQRYEKHLKMLCKYYVGLCENKSFPRVL